MSQAMSRKRLSSLIMGQTQSGFSNSVTQPVRHAYTKVVSDSSTQMERESTTTTKDKSSPTLGTTLIDSQKSFQSTEGLPFSAKDKEDLFNSIEQRLIYQGYAFWDGKRSPPKKWYRIKCVAGSSLLGEDFKVDFLVNGQACVICRWQDTSGTAYEKWPFALDNLANVGLPSIMVVGGQYCKPAMLTYLRGKASSVDTVRVCTALEFSRIDL